MCTAPWLEETEHYLCIKWSDLKTRVDKLQQNSESVKKKRSPLVCQVRAPFSHPQCKDGKNARVRILSHLIPTLHFFGFELFFLFLPFWFPTVTSCFLLSIGFLIYIFTLYFDFLHFLLLYFFWESIIRFSVLAAQCFVATRVIWERGLTDTQQNGQK